MLSKWSICTVGTDHVVLLINLYGRYRPCCPMINLYSSYRPCFIIIIFLLSMLSEWSIYMVGIDHVVRIVNFYYMYTVQASLSKGSSPWQCCVYVIVCQMDSCQDCDSDMCMELHPLLTWRLAAFRNRPWFATSQMLYIHRCSNQDHLWFNN